MEENEALRIDFSHKCKQQAAKIENIFKDKQLQEILIGIENAGIDYIKVGVFDIDGILRGKYMQRDKFISGFESGFGFCDVVFGWDSGDQLYDNVTFTGWHTAYPDAVARILPQTARALPYEENCVLVLAEFIGEAEKVCPRGLLRNVLKKADDMGYKPYASCEFEFFLFEETPHSVREKNYQNLRTITPGHFGYSVLRNSVHAEFYHELLDLSKAMRFPIESLHTETGAGVLEAALLYDQALEAADQAALFKTFAKVMAQRKGLLATFMAKWSNDWPGQSGHMHISLQDKNNKRSVFHDDTHPHNMSDEMCWFVGGQQKLMPELLSMIAPTVNSYRRLIPGYWAPTSANWGIENRTCALRVIPGSEKSQRVEYRVSAADINPYIALAAAIGSGLWGIENKIEPSQPVNGNAYEKVSSIKHALPSTLSEAASRLRTSQAANELFGETFVKHYAETREWEVREFRKAVTDWEKQRYFEII
jgi:glutamine synthetase